MSEHIIDTSDDAFDEHVLKADIPVLLDFWAEWCGPCKMIAPILEDLARSKYAGKVRFAKINIDENNKTPIKFGVKGIPTLILFDKGEEVDRKIGALSKAQLEEFLNKHVS
jgi:thioredoxin 1